ERAVASRVVLQVHPSDERRDVRLEESVSENDEAERDVKDGKEITPEVVTEGERELSDRHEHRADHDRRAKTEETIGEKSSGERREVDEAREPFVGRRRVLRLPLELVEQIQNEQRAHAVVVEARPQLRSEEHV